MNPSNSNDSKSVVVIDASVAINLIATRCPSEILAAYPFRAIALENVLVELERGRVQGRQNADVLLELKKNSFLDIIEFDDRAWPTFEGLVVGKTSQTLDDGEAATIAHAILNDGVAALDERKAIRICGERFPFLKVGCTLDIMSHPMVLSSLGKSAISEAIFNALSSARMRVLPHYQDWVIDKIGLDRARQCSSLPRSFFQNSINLGTFDGE